MYVMFIDIVEANNKVGCWQTCLTNKRVKVNEETEAGDRESASFSFKYT